MKAMKIVLTRLEKPPTIDLEDYIEKFSYGESRIPICFERETRFALLCFGERNMPWWIDFGRLGLVLFDTTKLT